MSKGNIELDDCGCCEGIKKLTPVTIRNPPGLGSLQYRIGTHGQFKASMIASISQKKELQNLTTRENNDLAIAIIDGWATIGDVLTFYQERIANEGFLRTATERRSILELARSVGYELRPGVAASTHLAFTIQEGAVIEKTSIAIGTKVQSIPEQGEMPQTFETMEEIEARPEWNELKPRLTKAQNLADALSKNPPTLFFKGIDLGLKSGDKLLVVMKKNGNYLEYYFKTIFSVEADATLQQTKVVLFPNPNVLPGSDIEVTQPVFGSKPISESDLTAWSIINKQSIEEFAIESNIGAEKPRPQPLPTAEVEPGVYSFRIRAGSFGHTAPRYKILPNIPTDGTPPLEWPKVPINKDSDGTPYNGGKVIYLDNSYPSILPNSLIVLQSSDTSVGIAAFKISTISEKALADFSMSAKVTGLQLEKIRTDDEEELLSLLSSFLLRDTTIYAQSVLLELAEIRDETLVNKKRITLDKIVVFMYKGQQVVVTGEIVERLGIIRSEIATIENIIHLENNEPFTTLIFEHDLKHEYKRDTVKLYANVAKATHGETKEEVLGSGDLSQTQQEFVLKQEPLTYVSARTTSGVRSTLEVRVDGVRWDEVNSLYSLKPHDRAYTVRIDDDGKARIIFGDGIRGIKPSAGNENIVARYRVGIGMSGMLKAGQLSLLMSRPLGVRSVTNPIEPNGADDPESADSARKNANLTILTMERIVSLEDFDHFAGAFAGIGKAHAISIWDGERRLVRLTVASATGDELKEEDTLYQSLKGAIETSKDPLIRVKIESFDKKLFNVKAKVAVDPAVRFEDVKLAVEQALKEKFSFEARQFNQPVGASEVIATMQGVRGVIAIDLDHLYLFGEEAKWNDILPSKIEKESGKLLSWLLMLNLGGVILEEMKL
jgi:hypothetical protein